MWPGWDAYSRWYSKLVAGLSNGVWAFVICDNGKIDVTRRA